MADDKHASDQFPEPNPQLESAVWSVLSEPVDGEAVERVKARAKQLAAAKGNSTTTTMPSQPAGEKTAARRRASDLFTKGLFAKAIAASLLLAAGVVIFLRPQDAAFGAAMRQLRDAQAFSFVKLIHTDRQDEPIESRVYVAADGRHRSEVAGTSSIHDASGRVRLTLIEATKTALVMEPAEASTARYDQLGWYGRLKSAGDQPDKRLGKKMLEGRQVEGFVVKSADRDITIWIDAETHELVRVEQAGHIEGSGILKVVTKDFKFDAKFDESLFSLEVPEGYKTVRQETPRISFTDPEKNIIEALRGYTELADGKFPQSITNWGEWAVLFSKQGQPSPQMTETMGHLGAVTAFLSGVQPDDYEYLGAGKTAADDRTIVFWHRNQEGVIRAIHNDLTAAVVEAKDLPKAQE